MVAVRWVRVWVLRWAWVLWWIWVWAVVPVSLEVVGVFGGPVGVVKQPARMVDQVVGVSGKPVLDGVLGFGWLGWLWVGRLRVGRATVAILEPRSNLAPLLLPPAVGVSTPFVVGSLGQAHALAVVLRKGDGRVAAVLTAWTTLLNIGDERGGGANAQAVAGRAACRLNSRADAAALF